MKTNAHEPTDHAITKCYYIIAFILLIIILGYKVLHTTSRKEDFHIACEIVQQDDENYTQVRLPDGQTAWVEIQDELISDDGKYVYLRIVRHFNFLNQSLHMYIMDTAINVR